MENDISDAVLCTCRFHADAPHHHDQLLSMETAGFAAVTELVEMAVTWGELEHGLDEPKIEPDDWLEFVAVHEWHDRARVTDLVLSLVSIVGRPVLRPTMATVRQLRMVPSAASAGGAPLRAGSLA